MSIYIDVNSPLWYFTFIFLYYLIFPLVFRKSYYWLSALTVYAISFVFAKYTPSYFSNVVHLYGIHLLAFPLGIVFAGLCFNRVKFSRVTMVIKKRFLDNRIAYFALLAILLSVAVYFSFHSDVGAGPSKEEFMSLVVSFAILGIFLIKKVDLKLFYIFGVYSYEIYLLHWPIMYRYDLFYKSTRGWLATVLYLILFISLGWLLKKAAEFISVSFSALLSQSKIKRE